jgi:hypothetical protein
VAACPLQRKLDVLPIHIFAVPNFVYGHFASTIVYEVDDSIIALAYAVTVIVTG